MVVCTAACQSVSLVTSRCTYTASPPRARMAASTFLPSSSRMSPKTTRAPSLTKVSASAAPCPRAPPLISATLPSSFPMTVSLLWFLQRAGAGCVAIQCRAMSMRRVNHTAWWPAM